MNLITSWIEMSHKINTLKWVWLHQFKLWFCEIFKGMRTRLSTKFNTVDWVFWDNRLRYFNRDILTSLRLYRPLVSFFRNPLEFKWSDICWYELPSLYWFSINSNRLRWRGFSSIKPSFLEEVTTVKSRTIR